MAFYFVGDTHIPKHMGKLLALRGVVKSDDVIIQVGDFGLLWEQNWTALELGYRDELRAVGCPIIFIDGNHENFYRLGALETREMYGADVGVVCEGIYHLRRGRVYEIGGRTFLALGGAASIDRASRIEGVSWWPEEEITRADEERCMDALDKEEWYVDYVLTHTCPSKLMAGRFSSGPPPCKFLDHLYETLAFRRWFCGHLHIDEKIGRVEVLFDEIVVV